VIEVFGRRTQIQRFWDHRQSRPIRWGTFRPPGVVWNNCRCLSRCRAACRAAGSSARVGRGPAGDDPAHGTISLAKGARAAGGASSATPWPIRRSLTRSLSRPASCC
jgi:hypothetical protein